MKPGDNVDHSGHRERLFNRYLQFGMDSLTDCEVLEILLFYFIPRVNTNDHAHRLLSEFGSIYNVVNADRAKLQNIQGIGPTTANKLAFIGDFIKRATNSDAKSPIRFKSIDEVAQHLSKYYENIHHEQFCGMFFDGSMRLIKFAVMSNGGANSSSVDSSGVARIAVLENAAAVIISHNHPGGSCMPSKFDHITTEKVDAALRAVNVALVEHIIIGDDGYCPTIRSRVSSKNKDDSSYSDLEKIFFNSFL